MNSSINAMARLVPACRSASRKLDKLTVLRLAAQHIKTAAGEVQLPDAHPGGSVQRRGAAAAAVGFLPARLPTGGRVRQRAEYLAAANCSNNGIPGAIVNSSDLIGQCLLDLVHPRDADLVRQELTVRRISPAFNSSSSSAKASPPTGWAAAGFVGDSFVDFGIPADRQLAADCLASLRNAGAQDKLLAPHCLLLASFVQ
uniref:BHLH domain-containing protein n=1 Tax=Macrostomum lignano TaxID=282301 RepID=A0A1I8FTK6_9PLAT